ncbi:MAG: ABC transporter ATP-binding protein, partial [Chloroflexota bacterium]|nr:ABC transporter ATP-binding protein [Chloroflexota bacterium]MED6296291.1 ABC transporter ATP-binding protein [Chloroflexota bacterium]
MAIKIQDVSYSYGHEDVIKKINLNFLPGQLVSLVGPNGAGKTTLLKLISGALEPTSGKIHIYDQLSESLSHKERALLISLVPQNPNLPEEMGISDFIMLGRNPHLKLLQWESSEDFEVVQESIALTEIDHLIQRKLGEVSGGERQRIMLAMAMTQRSPIMLLDEPTSNLDISHQTKVMNLIEKRHPQTSHNGIPILAIHDLNMAAQFSDRVILF